MPQVLKDSVKESILKNSLGEFLEKGYNRTSMKSIAARSGVAVGNIYRYFNNKEELYDAIVMPVYRSINSLFEKTPDEGNLPVFGQRIDSFIDIYKKNSHVFMMLLKNNKNTKFEDMNNMIIDKFSMAIGNWKTAITGIENSDDDKVFFKAFSAAYLSGIICILSEPSDEDTVSRRLFDFLFFMREGLYAKYRTLYGPVTDAGEVENEKNNL